MRTRAGPRAIRPSAVRTVTRTLVWTSGEVRLTCTRSATVGGTAAATDVVRQTCAPTGTAGFAQIVTLPSGRTHPTSVTRSTATVPRRTATGATATSGALTTGSTRLSVSAIPVPPAFLAATRQT